MVNGWLDVSELRVGLGCMRLSTDENRDEQEAFATIAAAAAAGVTVFDTAHAYGRGVTEVGHNERLLARALRQCGAAGKARIVTKGGMTRTEDQWIPDGRAKTVLADCEDSLLALEGLSIDLYLLHAPDPRTSWATSVRALGRILDQGLVKRVGVANVNRRQLEQALDLADISAVQVPLNPFDNRALRGGVVELCDQREISVIAHSPLGGPRRADRLARIQVLADIAEATGATSAEIALAWLLDVSPTVVAIPGARRPASARSAAHAARLSLSTIDRAALAQALGVGGRDRPVQLPSRAGTEVVLVMGIPGAGKSRLAEKYASRGYLRLNRDERGGSLKDLASTLDEKLSAGVQRIVLDNTYLTRASRSYVIETAKRHHVPTRCVWLDTPLAQAQVNLVERLLDRFGSLPSPEELRRLARREPGVHTPASHMRTLRELEVPSTDEGVTQVERIPFSRAAHSDRGRMGILVAADALRHSGWEAAIARGNPQAPHLIFDWCPEDCLDSLQAAAAQLSRAIEGSVEISVCPHGGGPPICWCRPPLPGLPMAFAHRHDIDLSRSILVGTTPTHRRLAMIVGARYTPV